MEERQVNPEPVLCRDPVEFPVPDCLDRPAPVSFPAPAERQEGGHPEDSCRGCLPAPEGFPVALRLGPEGDHPERLPLVRADDLREVLAPDSSPSADVVREAGDQESSQ